MPDVHSISYLLLSLLNLTNPLSILIQSLAGVRWTITRHSLDGPATQVASGELNLSGTSTAERVVDCAFVMITG